MLAVMATVLPGSLCAQETAPAAGTPPPVAGSESSIELVETDTTDGDNLQDRTNLNLLG